MEAEDLWGSAEPRSFEAGLGWPLAAVGAAPACALTARVPLTRLQVLYNAAAVYCGMGQWERASQVLLSEDRGGGGARPTAVDLALASILVGPTH